MHRAGPGERGGGSYGRRAVATAKWAAMQISGVGKGLTENIYKMIMPGPGTTPGLSALWEE